MRVYRAVMRLGDRPNSGEYFGQSFIVGTAPFSAGVAEMSLVRRREDDVFEG
jgi:hypothetical protein